MLTIMESSQTGLTEYLGKKITLFCCNYIYTGTLVALDKSWAKIEGAGIVYETGAFSEKNWKDMQPLPHPVYIRLSSVESVMVLKS